MTVQHLLLKSAERNSPQQSVRGDPVSKGSLSLRASSRVSGLADSSSKQGSWGTAHECLVVDLSGICIGWYKKHKLQSQRDPSSSFCNLITLLPPANNTICDANHFSPEGKYSWRHRLYHWVTMVSLIWNQTVLCFSPKVNHSWRVTQLESRCKARSTGAASRAGPSPG